MAWDQAFSYDGIAIGANFDRRFDRLGIRVAADFVARDAPDDAAIPDEDAWSVAASADLGGLRITGAYEEINELGDSTGAGTTSNSGSNWNLGARYRWGLNGVTLLFSHGEKEAARATPGNEELDAAKLSFGRTIGPGVKWSVNLYWVDFSG